MSEKVVTATSTQCSNKWESLKREYKKAVDNNTQTGGEKKTCQFYEEFGELYGHKSGTRPLFVMASRVNKTTIETSANSLDEDDTDECNVSGSSHSQSNSSRSSSSQCSPKLTTRKPLKRKKAEQSSILQEYTKHQEDYRREMLEMARQQAKREHEYDGKTY